jgi:ligand-binding sensor domain-containing protein/signal transduction histidine kinase
MAKNIFIASILSKVQLRAAKLLMLVAFFCSILFCQQTFALDPSRSLTQYLHRIWQSQQGLPPATIFSIEQTSDGYLWLGTQFGLIRFDGLRFVEMNKFYDVSLEKKWIVQILEDDDHALWIATKNDGLYKITDGIAIHFAHENGLPSDHLNGLLLDKKKQLWIATDNGLARIVNEKVEGFQSQNESSIAKGNINGLAESPDGAIWVLADGNQVLVSNGDRFELKKLASLNERSIITSILASRDGAVWIGTSTGLIHVMQSEEQLFTQSDGLVNDYVLTLMQSDSDAIWIGTKGGVCRKNTSGAKGFSSRDDLSQNSVYSIHEDREGSIWIGTKYGLNQFADRRIIPFTTNEGLPTNETGPVLQDDSGNIWIGTFGGGLSRYADSRFTTMTTSDGLASNTIFALAEAGHDTLWVGTDRGLSRMAKDRTVTNYSVKEGLPADSIYCLFRDRKDKLWVGTSKGLASFEGDHFVATDASSGLPAAPVLAISQPQNKGIIVATENQGVFLEKDGKFERLQSGDLATTPVDAFFQDADGMIWIGTRGAGLRLYDGEHVYSYTIKDGIYDDDIYGITADDEDRLWMACSKGIFSVRRTDLRHMAAGIKTSLVSEPFSPTESQRTIECRAGVQPAVCKMDDGKIWFTTIRGMIVIDTHHLQRKIPPVPVVIEDVIIDGKFIPAKEVLNLEPDESSLIFRYTALSFLSPARLTFKHKLDGFDTDWVEAGSRREAFYTNLPPGDYQFHVMASGIGGSQSEAATPITIHLAPHFYQTHWFWPVVGFAVFGAIFFLYRLRVRAIREQLDAIANERGRIARELHDTLMQGFSGVTMEMQALSTQLSEPTEREAMQEIITDATKCLRDARHTVAGLRHSTEKNVDFPNKLIDAARQIVDEKQFQLRLRVQSSIPSLSAETEYNLLRIAQESLSNAVKHSRATTITAALEHDRKNVKLAIIDDGVGFDVQNDNEQRERFGIVGMRERAVQMNAEFQIKSSAGNGTEIKVIVPLQNGIAKAKNSQRDTSIEKGARQ